MKNFHFACCFIKNICIKLRWFTCYFKSNGDCCSLVQVIALFLWLLRLSLFWKYPQFRKMVIEKVHGLHATGLSLNERFSLLMNAAPDRILQRKRRASAGSIISQNYNYSNRLIEQVARRLEMQAKRVNITTSYLITSIIYTSILKMRKFGWMDEL